MRRIIPLLTALLTFASCTKEGNVIYQPDPADQATTTPLVTVIYDANAVGDGSYNDLIYRGVEQAAKEHGLRTMQLSPSSRAEGLAYLQTLFDQMSTPQDTVRRLFIVAAAGLEDYVRQNNRRLEANPYADLLFLETHTPLDGKGSTLFIPYYGAMYEAGCIAPAAGAEVLLVAANPIVPTVDEAVRGFTDGFNTDYVPSPARYGAKKLVTTYLSDKADGGFLVADTTAMRIMDEQEWKSIYRQLVPVCGGAGITFMRLCDLIGGYDYMGIDAQAISLRSPYSTVKHIDRAVALCIEQWLSSEGMPKHQTLGLADGYTEVVTHPMAGHRQEAFTEVLNDELRQKIHEEAIRKEAEYEK